MSSTSSRNLTTLYSGAGSVVPQGAYGNANVVSLLAVGTDGGNTVANITATGNVTAAYFIGDGSQLTNITASNIVGNIAAAGSNTQIQFNTGNVLDASANLTFDTSTSILKVTGNSVFPTAGIEISANTITGNQNLGDLKITTYGGSSIHLQAGYEVTVGDPNGAYFSNAPIRAVEKEALQLTTTGSGAPGIIIGKYTNAYAPMTGNVDVYSSNVGGYGATGNINLSGNVYVSRDAQGADPVYGKANLIVSDSVSVGQAISAAGNITGLVFFGNAAGLTNIPAGNIVGGYGNANVAANLAAFANNPISTSGNITAGNVITTTLAGTGNASVNLKITPSGNATSNIVGDGSVEIVGATTVLMVNSGLITSRGNSGGGTGNPLTLGAYNGVAQADAKITINDRGTGGLLGEISLEPSGNTTSGQIPYVKIYGGLVIGNGWAGAGNILAPNSDQTIGNISASGNVTAANFFGNVAGNVLAAGSNTQVQFNTTGNIFGASAGFTFNTSSNALAVTGNVTGANINTAGQVNGALVSSTGNIVATANVTGANLVASAAVTAVGTITGGNLVTAGIVTAVGNVVTTSGYFVGDGSQISNIQFAATAGTVTTNAQPNITSVGILTALSVSGNITAVNFIGNVTGNITGNVTNALHANVADLANAVAGANVTGTVANATYATSAGHAATANTVTDAAQANITSVGTLTSLAVTGAVTAASTSVTGNSTAANVVATGLITSTQQTVAGTANVGTVGNIVIAGRNIATDMILSPDGLTGLANLSRGRIAIGAGNVANSFDYDSLNWRRVLISDTIYHANTTTRGSELAVDLITSLTGNVNNTSWQNRGIVMSHTVAGGSAANTVAGPVNNQARAVNQLTPIVTFLVIGGNSIGAGNTTVGAGCSLKPTILVDNYSTLTQGYGVQSEIALNDTGTSAVWNNYVGFNSTINAGTTPTGNIYAFYHGNANTLLTTGTRITNTARAAPNYYFLRNDDPVAQAQLGSLRSYNEFEYSTATSGTVNIDKTNAQVQMIAPTANVSIGDYQNFMTGISDGTNYDLQSDTVTLIIQQGATPYTVTLPSTANAQIKYSGGSSVVGATANAVTLVSISAIRNRGNTGNVYLTAVSTEFV